MKTLNKTFKAKQIVDVIDGRNGCKFLDDKSVIIKDNHGHGYIVRLEMKEIDTNDKETIEELKRL